ncbi:hypothetical protein BDM02DRAFT_3133030, partial [Thelephora ganbajun]
GSVASINPARTQNSGTAAGWITEVPAFSLSVEDFLDIIRLALTKKGRYILDRADNSEPQYSFLCDEKGSVQVEVRAKEGWERVEHFEGLFLKVPHSDKTVILNLERGVGPTHAPYESYTHSEQELENVAGLFIGGESSPPTLAGFPNDTKTLINDLKEFQEASPKLDPDGFFKFMKNKYNISDTLGQRLLALARKTPVKNKGGKKPLALEEVLENHLEDCLDCKSEEHPWKNSYSNLLKHIR